MSAHASARSARWTAARPPTNTTERDRRARHRPRQIRPDPPLDEPAARRRHRLPAPQGPPDERPLLKLVVRRAAYMKKADSTTQLTIYAIPAATTPMTGSSGTSRGKSQGCRRPSHGGEPTRIRSPTGSPRAPPRSVRRTSSRSRPAGSPRLRSAHSAADQHVDPCCRRGGERRDEHASSDRHEGDHALDRAPDVLLAATSLDMPGNETRHNAAKNENGI